VTNITNVNITNVYNSRVYDNRIVNNSAAETRVSYNGGNGVHARRHARNWLPRMKRGVA